MKMSDYWRGVMDLQKQRRAESKFIGAAVLYGRAEMMARAEAEMAEAVEAVERKASR
jgi:hypothetical protein